jgi:hypothetical protein
LHALFVFGRELGLSGAFKLRIDEPILLGTPDLWWLLLNVLDPSPDASKLLLLVLLVLFGQPIRAI